MKTSEEEVAGKSKGLLWVYDTKERAQKNMKISIQNSVTNRGWIYRGTKLMYILQVKVGNLSNSQLKT